MDSTFGNPETPDIQYQIQETIAGIAEAADAFSIPVISGNASLYNESAASAVHPTPIIGAVGIIEDVERHARSAFRDERDAIILLGSDTPWDTTSGLAGSEALASLHGMIAGKPTLDLDREVEVQKLCRSLIQQGVVKSAHDVSHGGIAVAIAESAIQGDVGATVEHDATIIDNDWVAALFGENQSRILITVAPSDVEKLLAAAANVDVPGSMIGAVGGDQICITNLIKLSLKTAHDTWQNAFGLATSG